jgi:hypothetical protein
MKGGRKRKETRKEGRTGKMKKTNKQTKKQGRSMKED